MDLQIIPVIIAAAVAIGSAVFAVAGISWRLSGQIRDLGGQISALSVRIDGVEKHLAARMDGMESRLGRLETEVHGINEYLRHKPQ